MGFKGWVADHIDIKFKGQGNLCCIKFCVSWVVKG
jgi:hypothetical protein